MNNAFDLTEDQPQDEDLLTQIMFRDPVKAAMIQEMKRLRDLSEEANARYWLNFMYRGFLRSEAPGERDVNLRPMGVLSESKIDTVKIDGYPSSIWTTDSFAARLTFLHDGILTICYSNEANIVPLELRLDVRQTVPQLFK